MNTINHNNDDYNKRGLYALVYPPHIDLTYGLETKIKVGRTANTFKQRLKSYSGSNKVTDKVAVFLYPMEIPSGCKRNYGFTKEEKWVRDKLKRYIDSRAKLIRKPDQFIMADNAKVSDRDREEWYYVQTSISNTFMKEVLDLQSKAQANNKMKCRLAKQKEEEKEKAEMSGGVLTNMMYGLQRFARSSFTVQFKH